MCAQLVSPSQTYPLVTLEPRGTQRERVPVLIFEDADQMAYQVARRIADLVVERRDAGETLVLGLPTGSTPIGVYRQLVRFHQQEGLDFSNVVTFNLDEYYPIDRTALQSYYRFMREHLFDHINIPASQIHIPRGDLPRSQIEAYCAEYEATIAAAGGIDLLLLGIGRSGHIGFNEPGSSRETRTRLIMLDEITRKDAASDFFGEEYVPTEAITMGVGTILDAREVILLATGEHKAPILQRAVEDPPSQHITASFLQTHPHATFYADEAASGELTRRKTPWLVTEVPWDLPMAKRAVIWLSEQVNKAILRLESTDFYTHHLNALLHHFGHVDALCRLVFEDLRRRIVYQDYLFKHKRVICFSPHPDDDVISMGGILDKIVSNENDVTVAYMTNGSVAVFDTDVRRYLRFVDMSLRILGMPDDALAVWSQRMTDLFEFLDGKDPGTIDPEEVQQLKARIRYGEAMAAIEVLGLSAEKARFLDMPFYKTGTVRKSPIGETDVEVVLALLREIEPHHIFVAGDLSDPHGTHRMCYTAIKKALRRYRVERGLATEPPTRVDPDVIESAPEPVLQPLVWLYRGAWQEWETDRVDVFMPLSKIDLDRKIEAIFKHESQKDRAMFPGAYDSREFWERARDRNRRTAETLNDLGLPEFYVAEAYVTTYDM